MARLHEEFIDKARRPMTFGSAPVKPKEPDVPIFATTKWKKTDGTLKKTFKFLDVRVRNIFIGELLAHEEEVGHHVSMRIEEEAVECTLSTRGVDKVTDVDEDFAKWLDVLHRETLYVTFDDNSGHDE